jgi:hypothetical protein
MSQRKATIQPQTHRLRQAGALLLALTAAVLPACDQNDPTGTEAPASSVAGGAASSRTAGAGEAVDATGATAQLVNAGTFSYPVNDTISLGGAWNFSILQLGLGGIGYFRINNPNNEGNALEAATNGPGRAVQGMAYGKGTGGYFVSSGGEAVYANTSNGYAVHGVSSQGFGGAALFENTYYNTTKPALWARTSQGWGNAALFEKTSTTNPYPTLAVKNAGGGYAGAFVTSSTNGKGVYIETKGGAGIQVVGGSKNAVVRTPSGAKALYSEESSEVWFTDYGFGKLEHGHARILFDPSFAQTINPDEPYHVFVQSYGDAELYVQGRTPVGFDVVLKDGDADAEFSYRIVAKRLGFEGKRLEPAPWVDRMDARGGEIP